MVPPTVTGGRDPCCPLCRELTGACSQHATTVIVFHPLALGHVFPVDEFIYFPPVFPAPWTVEPD